MKQTIYVDVLICCNLFINYFILLGVFRFLKLRVNRTRMILAAVAGAVYSLSIFLPDLPAIVEAMSKIAMSAVIVVIAFGFKNVRKFLKVVICFYLVSFIFGGVMFVIYYFVNADNALWKNGIVYFNISPIFFVFSTVISYIIIRFVSKVSGREMPEKLYYDILVICENNEKKLKVKIDTGNNLREPFSGLPVVVVDDDQIKSIFPTDARVRLVPFNTVNGEGFLRAFKPKKIVILNKERTQKDAYLAGSKGAFASADFDAIAGVDFAEL